MTLLSQTIKEGIGGRGQSKAEVSEAYDTSGGLGLPGRLQVINTQKHDYSNHKYKLLILLVIHPKYNNYLQLQSMIKCVSRLFNVLETGDRRISGIKRKAIILVGLSRAGKSTVFNYILNKPMIGKGKYNSRYQLINPEDEQAAKVSARLVSETLEPNIKVNYTKDTSLLDMAGFLDSRDYVGVIGVSYFLKVIFDMVREAKFLLVFSEDRFKQESGKGITNTFNGFIDMFHYDKLSESTKTLLKKSLAVVVTRSKEPENHYGYMEELIGKLKDNELQNVPNKALVIELMESVMHQNHFQEFKVAKENENPGECQFIEQLTEKRGWTFFNLDEADQQIRENYPDQTSVISLPIHRDFENLKLEQQAKYQEEITKKVQIYKTNFKKLLISFLQNFEQNWKNFIGTWRSQGVANSNYTQMKDFFANLREFLQASDCYNSEKTVTVEFKANYEPISFIEAVKCILRIFKATAAHDVLGQEKFQDSIQICANIYSELISSFRAFCSSTEEEKQMAQLNYVVSRGFVQVVRLSKLKAESVHEFRLSLTESLQLQGDRSEKGFISSIITEIQPELLIKMFNSLELLQDFEDFLVDFQKQHEEKLPALICTIKIVKGDLLLRGGHRHQALICYSQVLESYMEMNSELAGSHMDPELKELELREAYLKKLRLIQKIKDILIEYPASNAQAFFGCALQLCRHHNLIEDTCQTFDSCLASSKVNPQKKMQLYQDYANYCVKWGRLEKAMILLQQRLSLVTGVNDYYSTIELLCNLESEKDRCKDEALSRFRGWSRQPENDDQLRKMLEEMKKMTAQEEKSRTEAASEVTEA